MPLVTEVPLELVLTFGKLNYAALTTFSERMHRVQTFIRFTPPLTSARTL